MLYFFLNSTIFLIYYNAFFCIFSLGLFALGFPHRRTMSLFMFLLHAAVSTFFVFHRESLSLVYPTGLFYAYSKLVSDINSKAREYFRFEAPSAYNNVQELFCQARAI